MDTVIIFAFERVIVNFAPSLIGVGAASWLIGRRLLIWGFGPIARSLVYALFGTLGGLIAYHSYDFAEDGQQIMALLLVGGAMYIFWFLIALVITLFASRRRPSGSSE